MNRLRFLFKSLQLSRNIPLRSANNNSLSTVVTMTAVKTIKDLGYAFNTG